LGRQRNDGPIPRNSRPPLISADRFLRIIDREPFDSSKSIDYFTVRVTDVHLSAAARVYAYMCSGLPKLFAHVARNWQDFTDPRAWSSLEGKFGLEVSHGGMGHFTIATQLRSGHYERDWLVKCSVIAETSQLKRISSDIADFIGRHA
jgi:hypothetical protein